MSHRQHRNLVLLGFMGSGKSTIGRLVAAELGMPFVDVDRTIEEKAGMLIADLFEKRGEAVFRDLETEAVKAVAKRRGTVIATGGGVVLRKENIDILRMSGVLVMLHVDVATALHRTKGHSHRPLLNHPDAAARVETMMKERQPLYDAIPNGVETAGRTSHDVTRAVIRIYRAHAEEAISEG